MTPTCQIRRRMIFSDRTSIGSIVWRQKLVSSPRRAGDNRVLVGGKHAQARQNTAHVEPLCSTPFRKLISSRQTEECTFYCRFLPAKYHTPARPCCFFCLAILQSIFYVPTTTTRTCTYLHRRDECLSSKKLQENTWICFRAQNGVSAKNSVQTCTEFCARCDIAAQQEL